MAIDPNNITTVRVGELPPAPINLSDKIPHEVGTDLTRSTVQELADFIKDYIGTISGLAFNPTTVPDGGNLPNTDSNEWILVGKGTFHNVGGAPDITTTEELNALTSNGSFWTLSVEIPINIEFTGITQSVRSGYTQTVPSEDAVYKAIQNIYLSIKASNIVNDSVNVSGENVANALDNLQLNKLDKVTAVTPESQIYAKQADGTQAMFDIEKPSFEGIRYSEAYSGNIKSLGIDREILSNFDSVIPSSKTVTTALTSKVTSNVAITGSTKTKITYDSKGLVTSGTDAGISDITGLVSALSLKEDKANKNVASGYAGLDSNGKLFANQIPAIAVTDTFVVNSQAAMLALSTAEIGDVAIRTDLNKTFILKASPYSVLANWQELLTPASPVTSVFGRVGPILANPGDYTTALVTENTNKNYQTDAQRANNDATSSIQTQLNNKLSKSGNEASTGIKTFENLVLQPNAVGSTLSKIRQIMAGSDFWEIYGEDNGVDKGIMVFKLGDNGEPFTSNGQKFSFRYDASNSGVAKTPLEIDYNDITANANIKATSFVKNGATSSDALLAGGGTLANVISGTGINGHLAKFTNSGIVASSLLSDILGMLVYAGGVNSTSFKIESLNNAGFLLNNTSTANPNIRNWKASTDSQVFGDFDLAQSVTQGGLANLSRFYINNIGNVGLGITSLNEIDKLQVNGTVTASPAIVDTQLATLGQVKTNSRPYKVYVAQLVQSGTGAPVATVLENTLGVTLTWSRTSTGYYSPNYGITGRPYFNFQFTNSGGGTNIFTSSISSAGNTSLLVFNSGAYWDGWSGYIEIRIYP